MSDPLSSFQHLENDLWQQVATGGLYDFGDDAVAKALYHEAYFSPGMWDAEQRNAIREELREYLLEYYNYDFDEGFDWDAWREAYESQ